MKNLKIYFVLTMITSIIFYSCSKDNNDVLEKNNKITSKSLTNNVLGPTCCSLIGPSIKGALDCNHPDSQYSEFPPCSGGNTTFQYKNTTGVVSNANWTLVSNPAGSATFSNGQTTISSTSSVIVNYSSNFINGSISASGTGGSANNCQTTYQITRGQNCVPTMSSNFICRNSSLGGWVDILSPTNCNVDWSKISKIELQLADSSTIFTTAGALYHLNQGTLYPPFNFINNKIHLAIYNPSCIDVVECNAKVYYNNGCPNSEISTVTTGSN